MTIFLKPKALKTPPISHNTIILSKFHYNFACLYNFLCYIYTKYQRQMEIFMTKELLGLEATDISSSFDAARYVAERLRLVRRLKNLTLENLASKLGITRKQLQNYESAQCNLTIARLWEISRLLEIETE